jgi:hypothetical protein
MKLFLSVVAGLFIIQASAFANLKCNTAEGISFSIIENSSQDLECDMHSIVIGGKTVSSAGDNGGCSSLANFTGTDGSKIALSGNGIGVYAYQSGKVVAVNCNPAK